MTTAGAGVDVMLDDRGERPGAMFADWELIGVPHRVVISDRGPEGRPARIPAPPRRRGHQGRGRRHSRVREGPAESVIKRRDCLKAIPAGLGRGLAVQARAGGQIEEHAGRRGADSLAFGNHQCGAAGAGDCRDIDARLATCAGWAR
jgi:hypothetical protein